MKTLLVALLMHLYPRAWRAEYGAELERMLLARRLGRGGHDRRRGERRLAEARHYASHLRRRPRSEEFLLRW
ncbi:MAG TPA: hypothetical protein VKA59_26905, partial [Vicinamibacterales bacterium]|nr:hypothetical protein [Vicinamibacterales bacterium]